MISDKQRQKLIEIIGLAEKLHWLEKNPKGYPLMQLSEVEKCMIAMIDSDQLNQMRFWVDPKAELIKNPELKADIPEGVISFLGLKKGDTLEWKMISNKESNNVIIVSKQLKTIETIIEDNDKK